MLPKWKGAAIEDKNEAPPTKTAKGEKEIEDEKTPTVSSDPGTTATIVRKVWESEWSQFMNQFLKQFMKQRFGFEIEDFMLKIDFQGSTCECRTYGHWEDNTPG